MKILFIFTLDDILSAKKPLREATSMQFGISYISALLKQHGHATKLMVLNCFSGRKNETMLAEQLQAFKPHMVGLTAVTSEFPFVTNLARYLKRTSPGVYLAIGGPHVTLNPEDVPFDVFDAACIGEGEFPTLELVTQLEDGKQPTGIRNLWLRHGSTVEKNTVRPFLADLDTLPFPDREMWLEWLAPRPDSRHAVLLGRGCPFQCTYCCNHALKKVAPGTYVRVRSPENILAEITQLMERFPHEEEIYFEVETIGSNKQWTHELCDKLAAFNAQRTQPISFGVNLRVTPQADFEPLFADLKRSNFRFVNVGLESGSERVRHEILHREYANEDVRQTVTLARKHGLQVSFLNLVGIPGETLADFKETIAVNRACLPDWNSPSIFFPYPGTELYETCKQKGLLPASLDTTMERRKAVLDLPEFPKRQIQKEYIWFTYNVYRGHTPRYRLLARVLKATLLSNSLLYALYRQVRRLPLYNWLEQKLKKY